MLNKFRKKLYLAGATLGVALAMVACEKADVIPVDDTTEVTVVGEVTETVTEDASTIDLEDGIFLANFDTDSTMFHVNEVCDGKGILTVADGEATIHIVLVSKNIVNLYEGTVANLDETKLLEPVEESVTYPDGLTEEVYAFDVPVPYLDAEFDLALLGKKGTWYDHKVSVSNPVPYTEETEVQEEQEIDEEQAEMVVSVTLSGGSGRSTIESPAKIKEVSESEWIVTIVWSSPNYDYMIVDGEKIFPVNTEGNSTFELTIHELPCSLDVIADTVAMSTPHEIEYTISFEAVQE